MRSAEGQTAGPADPVSAAPLVDHHQHLFSPATAALISEAPIDGRVLVAHLDDAGIARAAVLSVAYTWGKADRLVENEYDQVQATNDWTSAQVGRYPDRLRGFCGVNPLRDYALDELARCAEEPALRHVAYGLKLHFGNSAVDYHDPRHVGRVQRIFRAANGYGMAIVVHMRSSISRKLAYGRDAARIFLDELLPAAPDVPVQIAHRGGAGGYADDPPVDPVLSVFVDAITGRDPRVRRLLFDVTNAVSPKAPPDELGLIARRIREIGIERVWYGSDAALRGNTPRECWDVFRRLPLSPAEFRQRLLPELPSRLHHDAARRAGDDDRRQRQRLHRHHRRHVGAGGDQRSVPGDRSAWGAPGSGAARPAPGAAAAGRREAGATAGPAAAAGRGRTCRSGGHAPAACRP